MFMGEHTHTIDIKGRLTIPARFREGLAAGLVVTRGYEPCLRVYPAEAWAALAAKVAAMPQTSRAARTFSRVFFGGASDAPLDKMGRVLLPGYLREYAGLREEAVVVGCNEFIEVWAPERLRELEAEEMSNLGDVLDETSRMGL
jgi:MraZ protein